MKSFLSIVATLLLMCAAVAHAAIEPAEVKLAVGEGRLLKSLAASPGLASGATTEWRSSDPSVANVYKNGFVVALKPGQATVRLGNDVCRVRVITGDEKIVPLSSIQQFKDNREFVVNGRKCVGSELNGKVLGEKRDNRVRNPKPLVADAPLDWEVVEGAPVLDGAGKTIGTVSDPRRADDG